MSYKALFEKYRPKDMTELVLPNNDIKEKIDSFYNQGFINGNILSYGPAGFGKTSANEILISRIIKSPKDIFILGRKVDDVEELKAWLLCGPALSKQKIVKIEEMNRLSKQAQLVIKDGLMEKYQHNCAFLATTNNPEEIDPALLTRFNTKINFKELPLDLTQIRVKSIMTQEGISFDENDVDVFIQKNINRGLREIISNIELATINSSFSSAKVQSFVGVTDSEDNIINFIVYLVQYCESLEKPNIDAIIKNAKTDANFWQYYEYIIKTMKFDLRINYSFILQSLIDSDLDLVQKNIVIDYYQDLDLKRFKSMHIIGLITDLLKTISLTRGEIMP